MGESQQWKWGEKQLIGEGCNIQAAINDTNEVVIVYSENWWRVCYYRGGIVQQNNKTIDWWGATPCKLADGANPTVAMRDRTVLFVHEAAYGTYRAFYRVGEIRKNKIWTTEEQRLWALNGYKQISVAINKSGWVLFSCRHFAFYTLSYTLGQFVGSEIQNITAVQPYGNGYFNHVSLLNDNSVIAVHESWIGNKVMVMTGRIQERAGTVRWREEQNVESGYRITAAVNNSHKMIVAIVNNSLRGYGEGILMYKLGTLHNNG